MTNINVDPLKRDKLPISDFMKIVRCVYCKESSVVKKGLRKKKLETVQLYHCKDCNKVFTGQQLKGKTYPVAVIIDGLSAYYKGNTLE